MKTPLNKGKKMYQQEFRRGNTTHDQIFPTPTM